MMKIERLETCLQLGALGRYYVYINSIVDHFVVEFLGPVLRLDEHEHGRSDALDDQIAELHQLAAFAADKDQLLFDHVGGRVLLAHRDGDDVVQVQLAPFLDVVRERGAEKRPPDLIGIA